MATSTIGNPFEGIQNVREASTISTTDRLKIAIVGKPKSGKSWFGASGPKPLLLYDFDDRAESVAGKEGVFVKTLIDTNQASPTAMKSVESDLSTFKYAKAQGKPIPATFVFDTITNMLKCMENEAFSQESSYYRHLKAGATRSIRVRKNWDAFNAVERYLYYIATEFGQLGNLIFIFHSRPEKDKTESTSEKTVYTDQITVEPQGYANILTTFNEVYRIEITPENKYKVTCKANYEFTASTTLLIDAEEEPDIMKLIAKHHQRLKERNAKI
jgi:hypothetical protein